jgi:hypothetical protein
MQFPFESQESDWFVLHARQLLPFPHCGNVGVMQPLPGQHWPGMQLIGQPAQAPPLHVLPWQSMQPLPPLPHAFCIVPGWHCEIGALSQQPLQVAGSQTQWPETQ